MTALLDLNVLLDVIQARQPHYADSAAVLSAARSGEFNALLPIHAVPTIFYLIERSSGAAAANQTVDWLLQHFDLPPVDKAMLTRARSLSLTDFEDALVASIAEKHGCDYIVSRNGSDFAGAPIPAIAPGDFLRLLPKHF